MSANVETMFYTREKPWHGMGTRVETAPTSAEALKLAGLDWTVEPAPVFFMEYDGVFGHSMAELPGYVANVRSSDGHPLGVVSDSYKIVQNVDAFAFTDNLIGGDVRYETAGSLAGGKRVWLLARLPETEIVGDKLEQYLVFTNTFDGSGAVRIACTPVRVVCQNTLNVALNSAKRSWSVRHTMNVESRFQEARDALRLAANYSSGLKTEAERLAVSRLSASELDGLMHQLFPVAEDASAIVAKRNAERLELFRAALEADDLRNFRGTKWQVINAAADVAGHAKPFRNTQSGQENRLSSIFAGHPLLDKAYELVLAR